MAIYPNTTDAPYSNPVSIGMRFKTLVSNFDDLGEEKRKQKWLYPKREVTLKYESLSKGEAETLWQFYQARGGSYDSFAWFESTGVGVGSYHTYANEYVGTGNSSTLVFNLPAINSSQVHVLYIAGSSIASTNYTFSAGAGTNSEDKITMISSTAGGLPVITSTERITYDFKGRLKIRCRFAEDILSFENFYDRLVNMGIKLNGVLNS